MKQDKIYLVVATDNFYAILLAALLKSIEENHHTPEHIELYIIDDGVSPANKQRIEAQSDRSKTTLHWFKSNEVVPADVKMPLDSSSFPLTSYMRLFSPYMMPPEAEKLIYLDVDMIAQEDISKLWQVSLDGHIFAAVRDIAEIVSCPWGGVPNWKELGMDPDTGYFNAGLMIMDTKRWKEERIGEQVIQIIHDNIKHVNLVDQYGLNIVLANRWLELDRRWNVFAVKNVPDPFIIHYLDIKPIFKSYNSTPAYQEIFYKYLRLTAWKNHKPVSDYRRLARKAYNKTKKKILSFFKR
ncbi:glycosyltransferase family 8 protein [Filimonas effusa]|uniref:Glycosyltransferase family 8 protein n=1 Tax=Filimonas effusa TaxID=2508721 RepID=A0A4Q1D3T0_9BACT|nr:glycosyltransferase family 8 protein [Filimonas effusa]RXK81807.1 glycosyltransferase family 8 protein [Filimonas effusa]